MLQTQNKKTGYKIMFSLYFKHFINKIIVDIHENKIMYNKKNDPLISIHDYLTIFARTFRLSIQVHDQSSICRPTRRDMIRSDGYRLMACVK